MLPSDLSPDLLKAVNMVGERYGDLKDRAIEPSVRTEALQKIGQLLTDSERVLLDCLVLRTDIKLLSSLGQAGTRAYATLSNRLHSIRKTGKADIHTPGDETGRRVNEFLFMIDPETFELYNEDGELIDEQGRVIPDTYSQAA